MTKIKKNYSTGKVQENQKHILVVDDEDLFLYSLEFFLTQANFKVTLKDSAKIALELIKNESHSFDLLILDILIPGFSGLDLIARMKSLDINIPIIVISGFANREIEILKKNSNIKGYLLKPFSYKELLEMVNTIFQISENSGVDTNGCD
jgi:DNA-binding response OmpR family regulator